MDSFKQDPEASSKNNNNMTVSKSSTHESEMQQRYEKFNLLKI